MKKFGLNLVLTIILVSILFFYSVVFAEDGNITVEQYNDLIKKHDDLKIEVDKASDWQEKNSIEMIVASYEGSGAKINKYSFSNLYMV